MAFLSMQFLLGIFTVVCTAHVSLCLSLGYNNNKDFSSSEFILLTPDETQRLKYGVDVEKRGNEIDKIEETSNGNINNQGPKNIVLFLARFPDTNNFAPAENLTENGPVYLDFPVKSSVRSYFRVKNPGEPLVVVSPVELPENLPVNAKRSCKEALDAGVAGLISWAERAKQMVTGFVSKPISSPENPPAATVKTVPVEKREIKDSPTGEVAATSGKTDASKDTASLQANEVASPPGSHVGYLEEPPVVEKPGKPEGGVVTLEVIQNGEKREASIDKSVEPSPWDVFDMVNKMRRLWFESVLNTMGFNFSNSMEDDLHALSDPPGSPLAELLRTILRELQSEAEDKGFLLVVSGEDVDELKDAVQLVQDKTDPKDTLIVVTGQCPSGEENTDALKSNFWQYDPDNQLVFSTEQQRPTTLKRSEQLQKLPFYATGPKSDKLASVKSVWGVPKAIQRLVRDRDNSKQKRSRPSNTNFVMKLPRNKFFINYQTDNGLSPNSYFDANDRHLFAPIDAIPQTESRFNSDVNPMSRPISKSRNARNEEEVQVEEPRNWMKHHRNDEVRDEESWNWGERQPNGNIRDEKLQNWGERPRNDDIRDEKSPNWGEYPRVGDVRYEGRSNWGGQLRPQHVLQRHDEEIVREEDGDDGAKRGDLDDSWIEFASARDFEKRAAYEHEVNDKAKFEIGDVKRGAAEHEFWKQVIGSPTVCDDPMNDAHRNDIQVCLLSLNTVLLTYIIIIKPI